MDLNVEHDDDDVDDDADYNHDDAGVDDAGVDDADERDDENGAASALDDYTAPTVALPHAAGRLCLLWRDWSKVGVEFEGGPAFLELHNRLPCDQLTVVQFDALQHRKAIGQVLERDVGDERTVVQLDHGELLQVLREFLYALISYLIAVGQRQVIHERAKQSYTVERVVGDEDALFQVESAQLVARFQQRDQAGVTAPVAVGHF